MSRTCEVPLCVTICRDYFRHCDSHYWDLCCILNCPTARAADSSFCSSHTMHIIIFFKGKRRIYRNEAHNFLHVNKLAIRNINQYLNKV